MVRLLVRLGVCVLTLALIPSRLLAAPIVLDFESQTEGDVLSNQFSGLTFSGGTVLTAGSLLDDLEAPPQSGVNAVIDDSGPITVTFTTPVTRAGGFFTYVAGLTFEAFDAGNNPLGVATSLFVNDEAISGDPGSSPNEFLGITAPGISSVTMTGDPGGFSFILDDFTYTPTATAPSPVAEPTTVTLVLVGGVALLRRRRQGVDN